MDIHLGAVVEHNAVLVQDIDLTLGRDLAVDAGGGGVAGDLVEGNPLAGIRTSLALVEADGRPWTDIEILPVEVSVLLGLGDLDIVISRGLKTGLLQVDSSPPPGSGERITIPIESIVGMEPVGSQTIRDHR